MTELILILLIILFFVLVAAAGTKSQREQDNIRERDEYQKRMDMKGGDNESNI